MNINFIMKLFSKLMSFIKKNFNVIVMAAALMLFLEMNDSKKGSRKSWWKKFKRGMKHFGHTLTNAAKSTPIGQAIKYGAMAITNPGKFGHEMQRIGKNIGHDFANVGKGIASAGEDLYHGRVANAYHDVTHGADGLARRIGDSVSGGAVSTLSDATGRDALDFLGRAHDVATGAANVAADLAHGDVRGAYNEYVNTASPYIQFGGDVATGGMVSTVAANTGLTPGDYVGNMTRMIRHPGDVAQGLVDSGLEYGVGQASDSLMKAGDRHSKISQNNQKSIFD